jgi:hypothetical protein
MRVLDRVALVTTCIAVAIIVAGASFALTHHGLTASCTHPRGGECSSPAPPLSVWLGSGAVAGLLVGLAVTGLVGRRAR